MNTIPHLRSQCILHPDKPASCTQSELNDADRLEVLKVEVETARAVFHAELAASSPILGSIFKEWPGAVITGVVDGPPPAEAAKPALPEPPSPEAVEALAHELLTQAERTLGVQITDRAKALNYYRARATAELTRGAIKV
jgi:hypothetical protein